MRITKKVFTDLALFMIGFGLIIGVIFPFFVMAAGVTKADIFTPFFIISCILAGIFVGAINIIFAKIIVGKRLRLLADRMEYIKVKLSQGLSSSELEGCEDNFIITVDSEDVIGDSAKAFNDLVHTLSNSMRNEKAITKFNEMLSSQLEIKQLAQKALVQINDFMDAEAGAILYKQGGELLVAASMNIKTPESLITNDAVWTAIKLKSKQKSSLTNEIKVETLLIDFFPIETIVEPLLYKNLPIGVLIISSAKKFKDENTYAFKMFLRGLALSFRNAITYEQLQKLAANDPLTSLYNRRFGRVRLTEEFSRAVRNNLPLGIIMFDIDHFKSVNDTYGHTVGDRALVNISKISRMAIREGDFLIRFGGEEFLVILPGASKEDTQFVAERLRHMVEDSSIKHRNQQIKTTISAGYSSYPENDTIDGNTLVVNADKALYIAKESGRNKVVCFSD
ncbi:MAG: GGDEF domain-containing protein [Spirochaetaceae bacterium]|nr:GGDEF domain-containing protein [Spirochaetaceae bacterium]